MIQPAVMMEIFLRVQNLLGVCNQWSKKCDDTHYRMTTSIAVLLSVPVLSFVTVDLLEKFK